MLSTTTPNILKKKQLWQEAMSDLITDPAELLALLKLDPGLLEAAKAAARLFPLRVPRGFAARMEAGNPDDPLLQQVLPLGAELIVTPGYQQDALVENAVNPIPGLLHKYSTRVLVMLTGACAVHCRYCFRRSFPYEDNNPGRAGWQKIMEYIDRDANINEVILSGGDPLAVSDSILRQFTDMLGQIKHVKRLRIHSRLPVVLPLRISPEFMEWVASLSMQLVMVSHVNHPNEINHEVEEMFAVLRQAGVTLLNQSVLLKNVNDQPEILAKLSEDLFDSGVLPYYLHTLDKVEGAAHFDLPLADARDIHAKLLKILPGFLVPRLVCETPGELSKTLL